MLVTDELSTDLLQTALRAGVNDVLAAPVEAAQLEAAVARVAEGLDLTGVGRRPRRQGRRRPSPTAPSAKVITVFSTKGGAGKSVLAANLAVVLAQRSHRPARGPGRRRPAVRRRRRDAQAGAAAHDRRRRRLARSPRPHPPQPVPHAPRAVGAADPARAARAVLRRSDQRRRDGADRPAAPHVLQRASSSTRRPTSTRSCSGSSRRATRSSSSPAWTSRTSRT